MCRRKRKNLNRIEAIWLSISQAVSSITTSGRAAKTSVDLMQYFGLKGAAHRNKEGVAVRCTFISELGLNAKDVLAALPLVVVLKINQFLDHQLASSLITLNFDRTPFSTNAENGVQPKTYFAATKLTSRSNSS